MQNINLHDVVQIDSKDTLNKNLHGVIGIVTEITPSGSYEVSIYYPMNLDANAFVKKRMILGDNLNVIGQVKLKPKS